ncbi:RNA polymerase subunit sigma-24 [candidate division BRC1 bacterium HGW-BRC1-1]|jgi:RNA polymerase sigma-70 factor (ECF subfamily)|nr:MAG: RNA polymerase subunit sigma-24 [candidate division BRC1 bacterium HGW-BRC1-1]
MRFAYGWNENAGPFDEDVTPFDFPEDETETAMTMSNATIDALPQALSASPNVEAMLIEQCKEGDRFAFDELISLHQERVLNTAFRLMGNYDEALDLTQEVFLNCFRKISSFKGDSALSTWLYRITVNTAKNRWKYQQSRGMNRTSSLDAPLDSDDEERVRQFPDSQPTPRKMAADRESMVVLGRQLDGLSEEYREVLVLRYIDEQSYEDIADHLGISLGTVKSRIHRARHELRDRMQDFL